MMNEINDLRGIWRGKRKDNGKWVQGSLLRSGNGYIDIIPINNTIYENDFSDLCVAKWYVVDPETLGECTGLRDKKGKIIFEGDIIEHKGKRFVIKYLEKYMRFSPVKPSTVFAVFDYTQSVIIGNIHDNPELLKGGK